MRYTVSAEGKTALSLNEQDRTSAILQNIAVILRTGQKTSPLYRGFGLPADFVDRPAPAAKALLVAAVREAVEQYEPRAEVISVTFSEDASAPGRLIPIVEVNILEQEP